MNKQLIGLILAATFASAPVEGQSLDQEMAGLASRVSKALVALNYKTATAIDFTDLQGRPTELGRWLSEHLAVDIVSSVGVAMVDRANIKSILAEHKLSEEGLVNPANAKKLGEFAGVDAIIIGNVTAVDDGIVLMVKAISTSSAQIVAAGRAKFSRTPEIQQLLTRGLSRDAVRDSPPRVAEMLSGDKSGAPPTSVRASRDFGPLRVIINRVLQVKTQTARGQPAMAMRVEVDLVNLDTQQPIAVALHADPHSSTPNVRPGEQLRGSVVDDRGAGWSALGEQASGIGIVSVGGDFRVRLAPSDLSRLLQKRDQTNTDKGDVGYVFVWGALSTIRPTETISTVITFMRDGEDTQSPEVTAIALAFELVIGTRADGKQSQYAVRSVSFPRLSVARKP